LSHRLGSKNVTVSNPNKVLLAQEIVSFRDKYLDPHLQKYPELIHPEKISIEKIIQQTEPTSYRRSRRDSTAPSDTTWSKGLTNLAHCGYDTTYDETKNPRT